MDIKNKPSNDMKPSRFLTAICLLATALAIGSCTQDEGADGNGIPLPEGKYPLMLTATQNEVVASPQTRVAENTDGMSSNWTAGDQIKVAVSGNSNDMETTCTLNASGNITTYTPKLYWKTTGNSKINAWYSNITGQNTPTSSTVSLADQSNGLAYVLKADEQTGQNYKSGNISLQFKHQLAKVRVKVVKGTYTGALNVTAVSVKGYTCTVSNGTVTASGTLSDIKTKKNTYGTDVYWEANLVPGTSALSKTITIAADNKTTTCTLVADASLASGNVYTYTVTVNKSSVNLNDVVAPIAGDGEYIITGTGSKTIIINSGSPKITLKDVTSTASTAIRINDGASPIILLEGTNTFTASATSVDIPLSVIWLNGENACVTIDGNNTGCLTINQKFNHQFETLDDAIIGGKANSKAGNITIRNAILNIDLTQTRCSNAAIIGSGMGYERSATCENISISNTDLNINVGEKTLNGACIGTGFSQNNQKNSCKQITIQLQSNTTKTNFLDKLIFTPPEDTKPEKVGKGGTANGGSQTCGTITWKNSDGTPIN